MLLSAPLFFESAHSLSKRLLFGSLAPLYWQLTGPRGFGRTFSSLFGAQTRPGMIELHDYWTLIGQQRGKLADSALYRFGAERSAHRTRWLRDLHEAHIRLRIVVVSDDRVAVHEMVAPCRTGFASAHLLLLAGSLHH